MNVSIGLLRPIAAELEREGVPIAEVLRGAGLPESALWDSSYELDREAYVRVVEAVLALAPEPSIGLRAGMRAPADAATWLSVVQLAAPSLRAVIDLVRRPVELRPESRRAGAFVGFTRPEAPPDVARMEAETAIAFAVHAIVRPLLGPASSRVEARFRHAAPPWAADYESVFPGTVVFGAPEDGLLLETLDPPAVHPVPSMLELLRRRTDRVVIDRRRTTRLPDRTKRALLGRMADGPGVIERTARELGVSTRALRRQVFVATGASPLRLRDAQRMQAAQLALRDSDRSPTDIGVELGFAEASSFYRAFKRWTGLTPREFRRRSRVP